MDAGSEPVVVGSLCEWLHVNRFNPKFQDVKGYF